MENILIAFLSVLILSLIWLLFKYQHQKNKIEILDQNYTLMQNQNTLLEQEKKENLQKISNLNEEKMIILSQYEAIKARLEEKEQRQKELLNTHLQERNNLKEEYTQNLDQLEKKYKQNLFELKQEFEQNLQRQNV
ncbi:DNA recombination protein RmuC, partial [Campylobacter volucris]|nr:DNA recombination protein RmuC [Campylobacter volucris]